MKINQEIGERKKWALICARARLFLDPLSLGLTDQENGRAPAPARQSRAPLKWAALTKALLLDNAAERQGGQFSTLLSAISSRMQEPKQDCPNLNT